MNYVSTRDHNKTVTAAQAIAAGISSEGGLFVPESFPPLTVDELRTLVPMDYRARSAFVLGRFLTDFSAEEVKACVDAAYTAEKFGDHPAPLHTLHDDAHILELWHGPTCAFKDMALQILPHLMRVSVAKSVPGKEIVILVATSGDTGKAALEGFKDAPHTRILVFYPVDGVSPMQKLQMTTQEGNNVAVCAIRGNFDDAQTGVKNIFAACQGRELPYALSSANSINIGRLAPQIMYYFRSYRDLLDAGKIKLGDEVNYSVPTGNFGDILAGYLAKRLGLPVGKLICASNANNVLTDFIRTGVYDKRRPLLKTTSPSMDILVSSNLERLLYLLSGDTALVSGLMNSLNREGVYTVPGALLEQIQKKFWAAYCDDAKAQEIMGRVYRDWGYLCDPHTASGWAAAEEYVSQTGDNRPMVVLSTASPYKFPAAVLAAVGGDTSGSEFDQMARLSAMTDVPIPKNLAGLQGKPERHTGVINKEDMLDYVLHL